MTLYVANDNAARVVNGQVVITKYVQNRLVAVVFATRIGVVFDESKIDPSWAFIGKFRAYGTWYSRDDFWYVVVAKRMGAAASHSETETISPVDADDVATDAPLRCSTLYVAHGGTANSVYAASDVLAGHIERVSPLAVATPAGFDSGVSGVTAVIPADPYYLQSDWEKLYGWPPVKDLPESDGYVKQYFRKYRYGSGSSWNESWWLAGMYPVEEPGPTGTTTKRVVWYGDTSQTEPMTTRVQRLTVAFSAAAPRPTKPVIDIPENRRWMDVAKPNRLPWTSRGDLAGAQTSVRIRRTRAGVVSYYDTAAQLWSGTAVVNTTALPYADLPAGVLGPVGQDFTIEVQVRGTTGDWSDWSDPALISTAAAPTATVTVEGLSGGVVSTLTPTVTGGGTPGAETLILTGMDVTITDQSGTVVARDSVEGMTQWRAPALTNGGTYTLRVAVVQTGGGTSDPVEVTFTVQAPVPGRPRVTLSRYTHETSQIPGLGVLVDFPWDVDGFDWAGQAVTLHVERSNDKGATWRPVGSPEPMVGLVTQLLRDWYAPHGEYRYRVRAVAHPQAGGVVEGEWGESLDVSFQPKGSYLVPEGRPDLGVKVCWVSESAVQHGTGGKANARLSSPHKAFSYSPAAAPSRQITVRTETPEEHDALLATLQCQLALWLLDYSRRDRTGAMHPARGVWLRVAETVEDAPLAERLALTLRNVTFRAEDQPDPFETA